MTNEQIRKKAEVMMAYADGKTVQYLDDETNEWTDCDATGEPFYENVEYRVKPDTKLRPYKNVGEFLDAQKEHGLYIALLGFDGEINRYILPSEVSDAVVKIDSKLFTYAKLMEHFVWMDGAAFGIYEEA